LSKETHYGGQAVIEGVMMAGPEEMAVAVRRPSGEIVIERKAFRSAGKKHSILRIPIVRGCLALWNSLRLGVFALMFSAEQACDDEEPLTWREMAVTTAAAMTLAVGLFIVLPAWIGGLIADNGAGETAANIAEGFLRLAVLLAYIVAISRVKDIRRVFQYHGAEHKVINAFEAGEPLEAGRIMPYSTRHPRCGTSFLLFAVVVSTLVFSTAGDLPALWRVVSRLALLPVVIGISYELIRAAGRYPKSKILGLLSVPGMWLQGLTTLEPDRDQVEVAIAALKAIRPPDTRLHA